MIVGRERYDLSAINNEYELLIKAIKELEYLLDSNCNYHDEEDDVKQNSSFCEQLQLTGSIAAVVDLSWGGWFAAREISLEKNIPYFRVEVSFI